MLKYKTFFLNQEKTKKNAFEISQEKLMNVIESVLDSYWFVSFNGLICYQ